MNLRVALGVVLLAVAASFAYMGFSMRGASDVHWSLNSIASVVMFGSALVCLVVAGITLFLKEDSDSW